MEGPSKKWQQTRMATLERARRRHQAALQKTSTATFTVCAFYLASFLHLQIFDVDVTRLSWVGTIQISLLGAAIFLVPISIGAMLAAWAFSRLLDA